MVGAGVHLYICSSTLHVGLTGTFWTLIQKSTGMVWRILSISFFSLSSHVGDLFSSPGCHNLFEGPWA